ncbi:MAG: LPS-assembly protein LptD [Burkholderiales bacterium]|nr:LPS-assembly protein LptD [Burkholderiales bacterium]MCA3157425.1 LPS-assembly protein LptD [Burkholderiales bacterium]
MFAIPHFQFARSKAARCRHRHTMLAQAVACACASSAGMVLAQSSPTPEPPLLLRPTPSLTEKRSVPDQSLPTFLRGQKLEGVTERETVVTGNAELRRGGTVLQANEIRYQLVEDMVRAQGQVRLIRDGNIYQGPSLRYEMDTDNGELGPGEFTLISTGARADAEKTEFQGKDVLKFFNTRYSTCRRGDNSWYLQATQIHIDNNEGVGTARNAYIVFQGVPLLASPYLQFPVNEQRRSGFLTPSFGVSSIRGVEIDTPYYWNIAPNRDYTLTPRVLSKRGLQLGNEFRYLEPGYNGITLLDLMPNDRANGKRRWALDSRHSQQFKAGWSGYWSVARASDDSYFDDFSRSVVPISTRQLAQEGGISYGASWWSASTRIQKFQVLQDTKRSIGIPYERVPQISARGQRYDLGGFDLGAEADYTRFAHPTQVTGSRAVLMPYISYPIVTPFWSFTPKTSLNLASYSLDRARLAAGSPLRASFHRAVPTFSLDTSLTFERDTRWFGSDLLQTFEPRLFYVKTPYKDQTAAPLFDTGVPDLNFAQLFSENRFSGLDRVADADQLTVAVSSRFIEPDSGTERLRATVGQRFYFENQRVNATTSNSVSVAQKTDFLVSLGGQITRAIAADATAQFDATSNRATRSSAGVRYSPVSGQFVSATYRLVRDSITARRSVEQVDLATQWPIGGGWIGVARMNYSTLDRKVTESLLGLEYRRDCWSLRAVLQRFPTGTGTVDTSIFFQLNLNGFTSVGSSPNDALQRNIPGYRPINEPSPSISPLQQLQ